MKNGDHPACIPSSRHSHHLTTNPLEQTEFAAKGYLLGTKYVKVIDTSSAFSLMLGASMGSLSQKMFINFNLVHDLTMRTYQRVFNCQSSSISEHFYDYNY